MTKATRTDATSPVHGVEADTSPLVEGSTTAGLHVVRCMGCGRRVFVPALPRGKRLRCRVCGSVGLNVTAMPSDPGADPIRKRREAFDD